MTDRHEGTPSMEPTLFVDPTDRSGIARAARAAGVLGDGEHVVEISKAGEGNMNLTLRIETDRRSFILKQSRPWVEKYPHIAAPVERSLVELAYYEAVQSRPAVAKAMPQLLGADRAAYVLVLEDLGPAHDLTSIYGDDALSEAELERLLAYLEALHAPWPELRAQEVFRNREMRELNHEHLFRFPLEPGNGLDLDACTPGLSEAAAALSTDDGYCLRVEELGELYLDDGETLLHGDFFPGSWLKARDGVRVIDPEFCFLGPRAFDLGIFIAHLHFAGADDRMVSRVAASAHDAAQASLARRFAGVELMRRLIGVAQLPLTFGIERKAELLALSKELVLQA